MCPRPVSVPYRGAVPCGQCIPCRINRQRAWAARILLEWTCTEHTSFVTLTYDDRYLPKDSNGTPVLCKKDVQGWLKRVRKVLGPLRFFAVGEYGTRTWRPHYHLAVFGPDVALLDEAIPDTWKMGFHTIAEMNESRAMYLAHYCTKKLTQPAVPQLADREPEFAVMSRRPGLGVPALASMAESYMTQSGSAGLAEMGDISTEFRIRGRLWPLDYFMRQKLRDLVGVPLRACQREYVQPPQPTDEDLQAASRRETVAHHRMKRHGKL